MVTASINPAAFTGIHLLVLDCDGVLTDGLVTYDSRGGSRVHFHIRDGLGIKIWRSAGLKVGILSGRDCPCVAHRARVLKLDFCHLGVEKKGDKLDEIARDFNLTPQQMAYIGDDINDIPAGIKCALFATPANGHSRVREVAGWVLTHNGGAGAVREFIDQFFAATGRAFPEF